MDKQSVIIVGGGISGLYAASLLGELCEVTILEASDRFGGRILDLKIEGFSSSLKYGAEFIHGEADLTFSLLNEAGISYSEVNGTTYRARKGKLLRSEMMMEGWDGLLEAMSQIERDMTLMEFLDTHFKHPECKELRAETIRYAEGYDTADPDRISVKALYKEWSEEDRTYQISPGYGVLAAYLIERCVKLGVQLHADCCVRNINWDGELCEVRTAMQTYSAHKVLVTVPLARLTDTDENTKLSFFPPLNDYKKAAGDIGFGAAIKIFASFSTPIWPKDAAFLFSDQAIQTWWTQLPYTSNILTGWAGGNYAKELSKLPEQELKQVALRSLAGTLGMSEARVKSHLQAMAIANWEQHKWIYGAYSYPTPRTTSARRLLNTPVADKIYFAGEALSNEFSGTVEAALLSAKAMVTQMITSLRSA
ncbi:flavin monoamine oxidase family protein [Pedobacter faecalis]|uniref:flavin monoamine oxidase family protein n=1 Tax=Pedobacter faecalis TaxID=3041495 RepID=UPI00254EB47D|nr:NAD(P)/FAD-dependent oxidoreductase [Pedobacter sp. ELA7]